MANLTNLNASRTAVEYGNGTTFPVSDESAKTYSWWTSGSDITKAHTIRAYQDSHIPSTRNDHHP